MPLPPIASQYVTLIHKESAEDGTQALFDAIPKLTQEINVALDDIVRGVPDDGKVAVSSNDTTSSYLIEKIVAGSNVTITENNDGGIETITIAASLAGDGDELVKVSSNDETSGYLNGKLVGGAGIAIVEIDDAGDETLRVEIEATAVTPGTYGDASSVAQFTVNSLGQITSAANVAIPGVTAPSFGRTYMLIGA